MKHIHSITSAEEIQAITDSHTSVEQALWNIRSKGRGVLRTRSKDKRGEAIVCITASLSGDKANFFFIILM